MKDKLEKFIINNREEFDSRKPDAKLWDKIEADIKPKKTVSWKFVFGRAAAVLFIFIASYITYEFINKGFPKITFIKSTEIEIPELMEAENYYSRLLNQKLEEIKPIITGYSTLEEELNYDLDQLDSLYNELKNDLKDNIANQEVIDAMVQNYRLRITILEEILSELKPNEDESIKKYNGHEI